MTEGCLPSFPASKAAKTSPDLAGEVGDFFRNHFSFSPQLKHSQNLYRKKRTVKEAAIVQEALSTVNKQLASELAISQTKCVQQESELALKDAPLSNCL